MDCIVHGILQARILEWVAFPFSRDLPKPGIEPMSPVLAGGFLTKEIFILIIFKVGSPEYSLEGLMLKLKLQYFGHLM